ncbi:MAG: peptidoglycan recognition protein family protein [Candidatus Thorarchaeota archaeon]|jgi:hypothetical protein
MSNFIIAGAVVPAPEGLTVKNYVQDSEPHFAHKPRKKALKHFVLHETAGRTAKRCKNTLIRKGYGVHLILARNGLVTCHGDLALDRMVHANQLNNTSIGIEIVNPYAPMLAKGMNVYAKPAEWWTWCPDKRDRRYILPSQAQLDALVILVPWLCDQLGIPYQFPTAGLNKKKRKITGWRSFRKGGWRAKPKPGVVAHRDFGSHADGRYPLEHLMEHTAPTV